MSQHEHSLPAMYTLCHLRMAIGRLLAITWLASCFGACARANLNPTPLVPQERYAGKRLLVTEGEMTFSGDSVCSTLPDNERKTMFSAAVQAARDALARGGFSVVTDTSSRDLTARVSVVCQRCVNLSLLGSDPRPMKLSIRIGLETGSLAETTCEAGPWDNQQVLDLTDIRSCTTEAAAKLLAAAPPLTQTKAASEDGGREEMSHAVVATNAETISPAARQDADSAINDEQAALRTLAELDKKAVRYCGMDAGQFVETELLLGKETGAAVVQDQPAMFNASDVALFGLVSNPCATTEMLSDFLKRKCPKKIGSFQIPGPTETLQDLQKVPSHIDISAARGSPEEKMIKEMLAGDWIKTGRVWMWRTNFLVYEVDVGGFIASKLAHRSPGSCGPVRP